MKTVYTFVSALAIALVAASSARAACITPDGHPAAASPAALLLPSALHAMQGRGGPADSGPGNDSIVGLWAVTFFAGNGPDTFDHAFELWHADGTELAIDNAVPPSLGNVCIGVWKQQGKTILLHHVTWNWNPDGTLAGTFVLNASVTLGPRGETYSGRYVTDSFDTNGTLLPDFHAEGAVNGQRIGVQ
jgi:hypothetical protein